MSALPNYDMWKTTDRSASAAQREEALFNEYRAELMTRSGVILEAMGELPDSYAELVRQGDAIAMLAAHRKAIAELADELIEERMARADRLNRIEAVRTLLDGAYSEDA